MKICRTCKQEKNISDYNKLLRGKDGHASECKDCNKIWRTRNRESLSAQKKEYWVLNAEIIKLKQNKRYQDDKIQRALNERIRREEKRELFIFHKTKRRAAETGLEFDIEISDIIIPTHCPILGEEIVRTLGNGQQPFNPSIDRIDSSKGYIKGNIQIISRLANTMKSNATKEQLIKFGEWCLKLKDE